MRSAVVLTVAILACGVGQGDHLRLATRAAKVCPKVHPDHLAGDWVRLVGASADGSRRMRLQTVDGSLVAHVVDGLDRITLTGTRDGDAWVLTGEGGAGFRLEAVPETCSLLATPHDGSDPFELLELPDLGVTFAYAPLDAVVPVTVDGTSATLVVPAPDPVEGCVDTADAWLDGVRGETDVPPSPVDGDQGARFTVRWTDLPPGEHLVELSTSRRCADVVTALGATGGRASIP